MPPHITIRPADGTWVVRAGGAVIGQTNNALELVEGDRAPVIYIPRGDIAMPFLEKSASTTHSANIGDASYYSVQTKSVLIRDAAWSFESPRAEAAQIAGHLSFASDQVAVEQV